MGVAPNSIIQFFKEIPLKNTYEDTFYFASRSAQDYYFSNLGVITGLMNQYRVDPSKNLITISIPYHKIYTYNYMRFKNTNHEDKWFYAFITDVRYNNENATDIEYEIDVMQTWLPASSDENKNDYDLAECFVEREHSITDGIGDNIMPESFNCNEYVINNTESYKLKEDGKPLSYTIVAIADKDDPSASNYDRVYSGCKLYAFNNHSDTYIQELRNFILSFSAAPEKILSVYTVPELCVGGWITTSESHLIPTNSIGGLEYWSPQDGSILNTTTLDGYTPKNKKCYTYPYTYPNIVTSNGDSMALRYEFFRNSLGQIVPPQFKIEGNLTQPVQVTLRPYFYKNTTESNPLLINKLVISGFPVCAWSTDAYKAYQVNQRPYDTIEAMTSTVIGLVSFIGGAALTATGVGASGGVPMIVGGATMAVGGASKAYNSITNACKNATLADIHDTQSSGVSNTANVDFAFGNLGFTIYQMTLPRTLMETIDKYFTMFGYSTAKVKVPNICARTRFTYTKTANCTLINNDIPVSDTDKIESIFNNGIRFWKDKSTFGNYTDDNETYYN